MSASLLGLHHVTATVSEALADLEFYTGLLGLRLVKRTINFDNPAVYHLYYGDAQGSPSTLMTTFPYKGHGVRRGTHGAGQITTTTFSVPAGSLGRWRARLADGDLAFEETVTAFGEASLEFRDPSGLVLELLESEGDSREPWVPHGMDPGMEIRGVHGVSMQIRAPDRSIRFLTDVLGGSVVEQAADRTRVSVGPRGPGGFLDIISAPDAPDAVNGLGTVHHVAMEVSDTAAQADARQMLIDRNVQVTEVRDRQYFKSIYFREPGGVLYEIATSGPGFLIDEDYENLGNALRLPSWEEPNRDEIELGLPPLPRSSSG